MRFTTSDPPEPSWRLTSWLIASPQDVPTEILRSLRSRLVVGVPPLLAAALIGTLLAGLAVYRLRTPAMLAWLGADSVLVLARLSTMAWMNRQVRSAGEWGSRLKHLTDWYVLSSLLWCFQIGCGIAICMISGDPVLAAFACLTTTGLVGGLASRNPGAPRMTLVQMSAILLPFTVGAMLSPERWFMAVAIPAPIYLAAVHGVSRRLHSDYVAMLLAQHSLQHQARHCSLTGLTNRAYLSEVLSAALKNHAPEVSSVSLLCLDLDGFKSVNDTFGHGAGDVLLQQVAERLRHTLEPGDVIARLGGDEFAVLLQGLQQQEADAVASGILQALSRPYELDEGMRARIGVSIGIATPADAATNE